MPSSALSCLGLKRSKKRIKNANFYFYFYLLFWTHTRKIYEFFGCLKAKAEINQSQKYINRKSLGKKVKSIFFHVNFWLQIVGEKSALNIIWFGPLTSQKHFRKRSLFDDDAIRLERIEIQAALAIRWLGIGETANNEG